MDIKTLALLALALLAGCDRDPALDADLAVSGPYALEHRVAWVLGGTEEVVLFDPAANTIDRRDLEFSPVVVHAAPAGLLLQAADGAARWLPVGANGAGRARDFALGSLYREAIFLDDEVLLHSPRSFVEGSLDNPNRVALVTLADGAVHERTLRSLGGKPDSIQVAPVTEVAGEDRQLCWVLAERSLLVFDLMHPEAREVMVPLTLPGDPRTITPTQVILDPNHGAAFVRAVGTSDVFNLIFPRDAAPGVLPRPYLNQLAAGRQPSDLLVREVSDGLRAFTVDRDENTVSVLHPTRGTRTVIELDAKVVDLMPYEGPDGEPFALAWAPDSRVVFFLDLDHLEAARGRAVTPMVLATPVTAVFPIPGHRMAAAQSGGQRIVLLDFDDGSAYPLDTDAQIESVIIDPDGARMHVDTGRALATVDVETAEVRTVETPPGRLLPTLVNGRAVVVRGDDEADIATIEPGARVRAQRDHILLAGVLDR